MPDYLLLETNDKIILEDTSGFVLLEDASVPTATSTRRQLMAALIHTLRSKKVK